MQKKLTITVDELIYCPRRISQFIEDLVRPHVIDEDLLRPYAEMAEDEAREAEAAEWSNALLQDVRDETR